MDDKELDRFAAMAFITRARMDVLESAFAQAVALGGEGRILELGLRTVGEEQLTLPDLDDRMRANAQASIRLADLLAASIGSNRKAGKARR